MIEILAGNCLVASLSVVQSAANVRGPLFYDLKHGTFFANGREEKKNKAAVAVVEH
jgi:hypothetical protein